MYIDIPDSPDIRDAEINGMPESEAPRCPVCGSDESDYFYISGDEIVGCDVCIKKIEVWDYEEEKE